MSYVKSKGQSTLEYVILIGFVVAALIAMGVYMKRGVQGKLRESTDQVGEQYDAGKTTSSYRTHSYMKQSEKMLVGGGTEVTINKGENYQTKTEIAPETVEKW